MQQRMSPFDLYERGLVMKQMQMFPAAIADFQGAAADPAYTGKAQFQAALCLKASGRTEEAIAGFRQAAVSPMISPLEQRHILYHLGRTLEFLGRFAESLTVYGLIRREDPEFQDVARRIKQLTSGKRGRVAQSSGSWKVWIEREFKPHILSLLDQTERWLGWLMETSPPHANPGLEQTVSSRESSITPHPIMQSQRENQPRRRNGAVNARRYTRVPIRLRSRFSANGRTMAGEGELRDLSPWGCRVSSIVTVPIGEDLQCAIFPKEGDLPFLIEGATVRWINQEEFGLAFTKVQPGVQQRIAQLCRIQTA